ncbi:tRNA (guanine-N1)-methyltransferase [Flavivirga eckloniae]|uniref:tRNA (Guanine-N1)-methyltransferase n=1 Tax=Flavivirga eckloniae TaxID=1803846 RepID=A0A2K9PLF6_9FLAO|nr:tRNA (guanine-N1)-methyltransferase [Flavivirga eckloniae]AUP77856.1 tRNA (guanine-N1)-methyltransferase [Flavivirga eckloniae]
MKSIKQLSLIITLFICTLASSQTKKIAKDKLSLNSGTLDNQFEFVIQKSYTYKGSGKVYKNVEYHWLTQLKAHTLDSLKAVRKDLTDTRLVVKKQDKEISDLKLNLNTTQNDLDKTNTEKNNMALFGIQMSKSGYNALMWSIIAGLLALLILFIYKYKNSNAITKAAKIALAETEEEFDEHRKVALDREQKVRRQLQDEINKQKGL